MFDKASGMDNPLPYLKYIGEIDVRTDDILRDGLIEVYTKDAYERLNGEDEEDETGES